MFDYLGEGEPLSISISALNQPPPLRCTRRCDRPSTHAAISMPAHRRTSAGRCSKRVVTQRSRKKRGGLIHFIGGEGGGVRPAGEVGEEAEQKGGGKGGYK